MELRFTRHMRQRMVRREITEEHIRAVLMDPLLNPPTSRNTRYDGFAEGRLLAVVIAEEHQPPYVVTAFWLDTGDYH